MSEMHSFSVEVAKDYGMEKAVMLNNFYFWCRKNLANGKNIYNGKAYTYNTSSAFAELFPYIKERKIAEILRSMEYDGLLLSGQFNGTNRVKSYTLTDKALEYYTTVHESKSNNVISNELNTVVPTYEKTIMEQTENQLSSITDNKQQIKTTDSSATNIASKKEKKAKAFIPPTLEEVDAYCKERNNKIDAKKFFDFYDVSNWTDSKGHKVKSWKQKIITWEQHADGIPRAVNGKSSYLNFYEKEKAEHGIDWDSVKTNPDGSVDIF